MRKAPRLHLVAGFLGSGKTTAIVNACKQYLQQGLRVGVVTNDQGKYLVDTAFFQLDQIPSVEVGGGCFCCNYADLESQLEKLEHEIHPDVIFAESVGSCADLVATVIKPLLTLRTRPLRPSSFSVFTDARLLRLRLLDEPLPFSEDVLYIFDQQIAEAALLVINKIDLIAEDRRPELKTLAQQRYPDKTILLQNSLSATDIATWITALEDSHPLQLPESLESLDIDYQRYGNGEAQLAWLDGEIQLRTATSNQNTAARQILKAIVEAIQSNHAPIGHLKFIIEDTHGHGGKVSITALPDSNWIAHVPQVQADTFRLMINARVQIKSEQLELLVEEALEKALSDSEAIILHKRLEAFHPGMPKPTYRLP
ncbi:MAG: hypothetical protein HPY45_09685 [Anaerolineae bacterium]|nr:hypothetical protein [Anaerolineae bacterium]